MADHIYEAYQIAKKAAKEVSSPSLAGVSACRPNVAAIAVVDALDAAGLLRTPGSEFATDPVIRLEIALKVAHEALAMQQERIDKALAEADKIDHTCECEVVTAQRIREALSVPASPAPEPVRPDTAQPRTEVPAREGER